MSASIYKNAKTDRQYSASTGLKISEFEILYTEFSKHYEPKKPLLIGKSKQPVFQDKREALFFVLFHLKTGVSYQVLGLSFNISDTSAVTYIEKLKPILKKSLTILQMIPKGLFESQADFDKTFEGIGEIFIDATEIPVARADKYENQENFYSGKKKDIRQNF